MSIKFCSSVIMVKDINNYNSDMYIVELGEPITAVIKRYLKLGLDAKEVASRTSMPIEIVKKTMENL